MATDPFQLFDEWYAEAQTAEINDPDAMALATADSAGQPSVRMVLLKEDGPEGFVFYTNRESRKGDELAANPRASLLFHWKALRRQIRIEGTIERVRDAEADAYFATRGRDSQLGAWASDQSRPLDSRATFEARFEQVKDQYEGQDVPRPPYWGGYRLIADRIEYWNDRPHRLHERRLFARGADGWTEGLLYP